MQRMYTEDTTRKSEFHLRNLFRHYRVTSKPLNTNKKLFLECSLCRDQSEARLNHKQN